MSENYYTVFSFLFLVNITLSQQLFSEAHSSQLSTSHQPCSTDHSFSADLINRELSPLSPFYNPEATYFQRLHNLIDRSVSRLQYSKRKSSSDFESTIQYDENEYLIKLKIGTPPVEALLIADTGSDLTWLQCKPCENCFKHVYPVFDFHKSSTYKNINCTSKYCVQSPSVDNTTCDRKHHKCQYTISYGSGQSSGDLAAEKLTFGKTSIENFAIGCGHNNSGTFSNTTSGIFGLGGGPLSITNQLDERIQGRFSYCMVPLSKNQTSRITFGEKSNPKAVWTPLFMKPDETYYYLNLERVVIGNKSFEFKIDDGDQKKSTTGAHDHHQDQADAGNIIIDSGTTLTSLPSGKFFDGIISALKQYIGAKTVPIFENFDLCYNTSTSFTSKVPLIAFHFTRAAIWKIPPSSAFIETGDGVTCFAVVKENPTEGSRYLFGNMFQQDYRVSYDLHNKRLSFEATNCTKRYYDDI